MPLEIITVRASPSSTPNIRALLRRLARTPSSEEYGITLHERMPRETGDISVHLVRASASHPASPSTLGLQVADALREYGSVDHGLWVPLIDLDDEAPGPFARSAPSGD